MPKFTSDRRFGIEIEMLCTGGMSSVVNAMEEQGLTAIAMSWGQHQRNGYNTWHVTTDSSLRSNSGVEVVSPPMQGEEAFEQIEKLGKALKSCGATVTRDCGFHVHVEAQEMVNECGWATTLMKLFMKYEHVLDAIQPPSRKHNNNRYCKTMRKPSAGLAETFKRFGRYSETARFWGEQYGDKYMKLNLNPLYRQGTVEFRHHSGTVEASKIMAWVKTCIGMVETARKAKNVRAFNPKAKAVEVVFEEDRKLKLDADFNALMKVVKADRQTKKVLRDRFEKNWNR